jgi:putative PIN family toxin of toxin-antitoxin system
MDDLPYCPQYGIIYNVIVVLDTDVIVAAVRSSQGASSRVIAAVLTGELGIALSVGLALEYEAVAKRPEHLAAGGLTAVDVDDLLARLYELAQQLDLHFRWRPQLRDNDDEMVLETSVNANCIPIVSFNCRDLQQGWVRFGIDLLTPVELLRKVLR